MTMQPPDRVYLPGSDEFHEAIEQGILQLSLPVIAPGVQPDKPNEAVPSIENDDNNTVVIVSPPPLQERFLIHHPMEPSRFLPACKSSKRKYAPSGSRNNESFVSSPGVVPTIETTRFDDIIGHGSVKVRIHELLLSMLPAFSDVMTGIRSLPTSILLHGPPGCGKTKLARAIAGEAQAAFLPISPSDILSKYVGESEAHVREIFAEAWNRASQLESKCAVIFLDEIDSLGLSRSGTGSGTGSGAGDSYGAEGCSRRVLAELLLQLNIINDRKQSTNHHQSPWMSRRLLACVSQDEDEPNANNLLNCANVETSPQNRIMVVAATNRPQDCDPALLRRFGLRLFVGLPTQKHRKQLLSSLLRGVPCNILPEEIKYIAEATAGWSGSDLESLAREAAMAPVRECIRSATLYRKELRKRAKHAAQLPKEDGEEMDADSLAREFLEKSLLRIRPVVMMDFERAVEFWLHNGQGNVATTSTSPLPKEYDSSSDEEE